MPDKSQTNTFTLRSAIQEYAGERKFLFPIFMVLAAFSGIIGVLPYYIIWHYMSFVLARGAELTIQEALPYALSILASQIVAIVLAMLAGMFSHQVAFRVEKNLRRRQVEHLLELPPSYFSQIKSGELRRQIDDNASRTHSLIAHNAPDLMMALVAPIALLVLIFTVDWRFGLLCLLGILGALISMKAMMNTESKEATQAYMRAGEELGATGTEYFRGIPVVKVFNQSVHSMSSFLQSIKDYSDLTLKFCFGSRAAMIGFTLCLYFPTLAVMVLAMYFMPGSPEPLAILADSLFYIIISQLFNGAFMKLMVVSNSQLQFKLVGSKLEALLAEKPLTVYPKEQVHSLASYVEDGISTSARVLTDSRNSTNVEPVIAVREVNYSYPGRASVALKDISCDFYQGRSYALVGASGSGKSSLIKLMARFFDPDSGDVFLQGKNLKTLSEAEIYSQIAMVFQENKLFNATLRYNLSMGHDYSDEELLAALREANASEILERLEHGLDTQLGTKGSYLSGGEIQRVAIARAFLKDAPILLLDEATASADLQNEALIYEALKRLQKGKTTIMIAHRLSGITDVDKIYTMSKGEIVASGSHTELMQNSPLYSELYQEYRRSLAWRV